MKILHIIDSAGLYGAEKVLLNLVDEQVKLGLEPAIYSIGSPGSYEKPLETEALKRNFRIKKFRMQQGPNILGAVEILKSAHNEQFDLIHSHGYKGNIFFGFIPKKQRKIPLISTLHGWTNTGSFNKMKIYEWLDGKSLKHIDAVVVVNKNMLLNPRLKNQGSINLSVINNGIPPHNADADTHTPDQEIIDFCNKGFTIGSIGRLSTEKGFNYLIDAFSILVKKGINLRLVIIGEGYQRRDLQKRIDDLKLSERILLPGYRNEAKMYLPFFNIFVISSLTEGLPVTLLEAMQARTPVVTAKVGGIPDVLKDGKGGLLVNPGNSDCLAAAILKTYNNSETAKQLVSFSYNEVTTKYSSKRMAQEYLDTYITAIDTFSSTGQQVEVLK